MKFYALFTSIDILNGKIRHSNLLDIAIDKRMYRIKIL